MCKFNRLSGLVVGLMLSFGGFSCTPADSDVGVDESEMVLLSVGDPCVGWSQCDDGNACNGVEACVAGHCVAGTVLDCDDTNDCTIDTCDTVSGCLYSAYLGAHLCTQQPLGYCHGLTCMSGIGSECSTLQGCPPSSNECADATCVNGYCVDYAKEDGTLCNDAQSTCYQGSCL